VKNELETTLGKLSGKGVRGKGPRGAERRKLWEEVKAQERVRLFIELIDSRLTPIFRYRQREGGAVKSVLSESQVVLATCHSSGGRQLWNQDFNVVIIDKATQALEAVGGLSFVA
jgi:DNA polymerase alpha-associated DNA helicase A